MVTFIYLSAQKILEYPLEYASTFHIQKLYQVHLSNSEKLDYVGRRQLSLVYMYFYSR